MQEGMQEWLHCEGMVCGREGAVVGKGACGVALGLWKRRSLAREASNLRTCCFYHYIGGVWSKRQERVEALSATCSVPLLRAAKSPPNSLNWFIEPERFYFSRLPSPVGYFPSPPFPQHPENRQKFDDETLELVLEHHNRASFRSEESHPPVATSPRTRGLFIFDRDALRASAHWLCKFLIDPLLAT